MELIDIPEILYNSKTGKPFDTCSLCESHLDEALGASSVEKVFKRDSKTGKPEVIIEYALCPKCATEQMQNISKESAEKINNYMSFFINKKKRVDTTPEEQMKYCLVTEYSVDDSEQFQVVGRIARGKLIFDAFSPVTLSDTAAEEIQLLLSEQTKDFFNGFLNKVSPPDNFDKKPKPKFVPI